VTDEAQQEAAQLLEAKGGGAEYFDAPTLFFLTFEEDIRRWSSLSAPTRESCQQYLLSLQPDIETLGATRNLQMLTAETAGSYHHELLCFPDTPVGADGTPAIAFCLGWQVNRFRMSGGTHTPFVGIRTTTDDAGSRARDRLMTVDEAAARELRRKHSLRGSGDKQWPVWRQLQSPHGWWTDLDGHRNRIMRDFEDLIHAFSPYVGRAATEDPTAGLP
jgi:hypothetical protein